MTNPGPDESTSGPEGGQGSTSGDTTAFPQPPGAGDYRSEGRAGGVASVAASGAAGTATPVVSPTRRRGPMQTTLVLRRIDPWSTFTTVIGLMFALFLVWMVAIGVVYLLLSGMGVWDRLGGLLSGVAGDETASVIDAGTVFVYAGGVGLLNVLTMSILATLAVFIYNYAAGLIGGGIQVTLSDRGRAE